MKTIFAAIGVDLFAYREYGCGNWIILSPSRLFQQPARSSSDPSAGSIRERQCRQYLAPSTPARPASGFLSTRRSCVSYLTSTAAVWRPENGAITQLTTARIGPFSLSSATPPKILFMQWQNWPLVAAAAAATSFPAALKNSSRAPLWPKWSLRSTAGPGSFQ